jgi:cyclic pyranopterin phosphate synthase
MEDSFGREVNELRISLTQRCNLACVFCHMEGQPPSPLELTPEEFERTVRAAVRLGIRRVKLTGGEPTLRSDVVEIVHRISPLLEEVSMTTNGLRLDQLARPLRDAGLARVNISLPSALPETYHRLTGAPSLPQALRGIRAAREAGLSPLKLNVVVLAGITEEDREHTALRAVAEEVGAALQFIEFEPVRGRVDMETYQALHAELVGLDREASRQALHTEVSRLHNRPRYTVPTGKGPLVLEIVRPINNPDFCAACHRVRLTSFGALKGCLMTNHGLVDLLPALRSGATPEELEPYFSQVIARRRPFFTARAGEERTASPDEGEKAWPGPSPAI